MKTSLNVLSVCVSVLTAGCASMTSSGNSMTAALAPDKLAPPAGAKLVKKVPAIGVQIYKCALANGQHSWVFVAPEADLFDETGRRFGRHGAGPFWEMNDGSKVVGALSQRADAVRPDAIPHLLLTTKSTGGAGLVANIAYLQRLNTVSGIAPTGGCAAADIDKQARVYYTADYMLFTAR
jgi:Protein of unknown function (DUF3455)